MSDRPEWFTPRRYGVGTGKPISWQGWALTIAFIASIVLASLFLHRSRPANFSVVAALTVVFVVINAKTTRGGWRWRWGEDD